MSEPNQKNIPDRKTGIRNFAAWYAIVVPAVSTVCILLLIETRNSVTIPAPVAALIFMSSFVMAVLILFGRSVEGGTRALVFVGMLISAFFGGLALLVWFLNEHLRC